MNTKMLLALTLTAAVFTGCASMEEKLAKHVGCTKEEATVTRELMVPAYQEYKVMCKNVEYSCKIAPFTEVCDAVKPEAPKSTVVSTPLTAPAPAPAKVTKKKK